MPGLIVFDPENDEVGLSTGDDVALNTFLDIENDSLYFTDGESIFEWEGNEDGKRQTYIWKSGEVRMPSPVNMGAALVEAPLYEELNVGGTEGDLLYNDVLFLSKFEGANGATADTELSQYAEAGTFGGNSQISTTDPIFGTSSLDLDDTANTWVTYNIGATAKTAWNAAGKVATLEMAFRVDSLPTSGFDDKGLVIVGDDDSKLLNVELDGQPPSMFLRAGFSSAFLWALPGGTLTVGEEYFLILEEDYRAGPGNGVGRLWLGTITSGTLNLLDTKTGLTAKDPATVTTDTIQIGRSGVSNETYDGQIDQMRITVSDNGRYDTAATQSVPADYDEQAGVPGDDYNIIFRLYAEDVLKHTQIVTDDEPFRLPGGYLSNIYSVEIESALPVTRVSVAENIFELSEG